MGFNNSPITEPITTETKKPVASNTTSTSSNDSTKKSPRAGNVKEVKSGETLPGWTVMRPLKRRAAKGNTAPNGSPDPKGDIKGASTNCEEGYGNGVGLDELRSDDDLLEEHEAGGHTGRNRGNRSTDSAGLSGESVEEGSFGEFKVYKRRWFGLVQLVLLNIIVSWDVRLSNILP